MCPAKKQNSTSTKTKNGDIGEKQLFYEKNRPGQNEQLGRALSNATAHGALDVMVVAKEYLLSMESDSTETFVYSKSSMTAIISG